MAAGEKIRIGDLDDCRGRDLLCWISYPPKGSDALFIHPLFVLDGAAATPIAPAKGAPDYLILNMPSCESVSRQRAALSHKEKGGAVVVRLDEAISGRMGEAKRDARKHVFRPIDGRRDGVDTTGFALRPIPEALAQIVERDKAEGAAGADEVKELLAGKRESIELDDPEDLDLTLRSVLVRDGEALLGPFRCERALGAPSQPAAITLSRTGATARFSAHDLNGPALRFETRCVTGLGANGADQRVVPFDFLDTDGLLSAGELLVDALHAAIAGAHGRSELTRDDVVNLLVCLTQGYVTTFAGMPGTGKSSLCTILGQALGLAGSGRFVEINVENGWTSHKDYIGYANPLLGSEPVKAKSEVFDALRALGEEGPEEDPLPYVFLLDEANLSPLEHYWAPFMRACDTFETRGATLDLGGGEGSDNVWTIPSWTRFLATVNFDHTTEQLSPRFLDRTWVIFLEGGAFDPWEARACATAPTDEQDEKDGHRPTMRELQEVFGAHGEVPAEVRECLSELVACCEEHGHPVSPRSQIMMAGYLRAACRLMDCADDPFRPLDYAFSQKVLPQLSGFSDDMRALLDDLEGLLGERAFPHTRRDLERMRKSGESNGYYQFFA